MPGKISVIIPTYNEVKAIPLVLARFQQVQSQVLAQCNLDTMELIVVDDCSNDGSVALLRSQKMDNLRLICNRNRLGYGGSIKAGLREANGEFVAFYDMDCTYDPADIPAMFAVLIKDQLDMVSGDRLSQLSHMPSTRKIGNLLFVSLLTFFFRKKVYDSCSGLRLFRHRLVAPCLMLLPETLDFTLSMTILAIRFGIPFKEVPIGYYRREGESKLKILIDGPRFLFTIIGLWLTYQLAWQRVRTVAQILEVHLGLKQILYGKSARELNNEPS